MPGRRASLVFAVLGAIALIASGAEAQLGITIGSGLLTGTVSDVTLSSVTLDGANQTRTATPSIVWNVVDARGTGAAWTVTASAAADLTSAAGSVETTARTFARSNLSIEPGTLTAGLGSDPTTNISASTVSFSGSSQNMIVCSGTCKGTYTYSPTFTLNIPANAYRSNYSGAVGSSSLNAYTVTLTFTLS